MLVSCDLSGAEELCLRQSSLLCSVFGKMTPGGIGEGVGNRQTGASGNISGEFLSLFNFSLVSHCSVFIVSSLVVKEKTLKERQAEYGACGGTMA